MENENQENQVIEGQEITEMQMAKATQYVCSYVEFNGGNPNSIDWANPPKFLPPDVRAAWDTVNSFWDAVNALGITI